VADVCHHIGDRFPLAFLEFDGLPNQAVQALRVTFGERKLLLTREKELKKEKVEYYNSNDRNKE
jgi:hypothetical protein